MAVDRPIYIAGSIAPYDNWGSYDAVSMQVSYREQACLLAENNVDLLLLEMLGTDVQNTVIAIEEASKTDLPVWVSISCLDHPSTGELYLGARESAADASEFLHDYERFDAAIQRIMGPDVSLLSMMHSEARLGTSALSIMRENFAGPLGIYPNAGYWQRPNWTFVDKISPTTYWQAAQTWLNAGAQVVGGCCGIGPEHIRAVAEGVRGV